MDKPMQLQYVMVPMTLTVKYLLIRFLGLLTRRSVDKQL